MPRRPNALVLLHNASDETSRFLDTLARTSDRLAERTSEGLFGTLGGVLGSIAAYGLTLAVPAASFAIAAPLGGGLGIVVGLLAVRGTGRLRLERRIQEQSLLSGAILEQIKSLPKNAPPAITQKLWEDYERTIGTLGTTRNIKALPAPTEAKPLLLAPPGSPPLLSAPDVAPTPSPVRRVRAARNRPNPQPDP